MENIDEIIRLVGEPFKTTGHMNPRRMLPSLDRFHTPRLEERKPGTFDPSVGPEKWVQFLDKTGLEFSVLFPTEGLAYGQVAFAPWAIAYAKAYNDWLYAKYLKFNSRLKGIALIPLQDVPGAVTELRRAVKELGMVGAMLPSNGLNSALERETFLAGLRGSRQARLRAGRARRLLRRSWVSIPTRFSRPPAPWACLCPWPSPPPA